jgi:hypothetical protein
LIAALSMTEALAAASFFGSGAREAVTRMIEAGSGAAGAAAWVANNIREEII